MADDVIHESDIVVPDGSIDKLLKDLTDLSSTYNSVIESIRKNAARLETSIGKISGATKTGQEAIEAASAAAERLEKAQRAAALSTTEIGKQIELLKAKTREQNKVTVEQAKMADEVAGSYAAMNRELKSLLDEWKKTATDMDPARLSPLEQKITLLAADLAEAKVKLKELLTSMTEAQRLQGKIDFFSTDDGRQVIALQQELKELKAREVELLAKSKELSGSYNAWKREVTELTAELHKMDTAGDPAKAQALADRIKDLKSKMAGVDSLLKNTTTALTENQKAQERLNFLLTAEGQQLLTLRERIGLATRSHREATKAANDLAIAQQKLAQVGSAEQRELFLTNQELAKQTKLMQLNETIAHSGIGSYEQLAAQYEKNKIELETMSRATQAQKNAAAALEKETQRLYNRMKAMQEAMGSHRLSVGEYNKVWNGLGYSVNQVVRELPAAAISLNTFFLAISNNVPIVIDEIQRLKIKNESLRAEGKPTESAIKTIVKSLFSWQTALILVLTALSMHGKKIVEWIKDVANGTLHVMTMEKALTNIRKEIEKSSRSYGEQVMKITELSKKWKNLGDDLKKQEQFIKDNASEFKKLNINIKNVDEATNLLVKNTDVFIKAMRLRAKITAASSLAAEEYQKTLAAQMELEKAIPNLSSENVRKVRYAYTNERGIDSEERARRELLTTRELMQEMLQQGNKFKSVLSQALSPISSGWNNFLDTILFRKAGTSFFKDLKSEADDINEYNQAAEEYIKLMIKWQDEYNELGIEEWHAKDKSPKGKTPKDLSDIIKKTYLKILRKYNKAFADIALDEIEEQWQQIAGNTQAGIEELQQMYDKNVEYLKNEEGKYKPLTTAQKEQIQYMQELIEETQKALQTYEEQQLEILGVKQLAIEERIVRERFNIRGQIIEESIEAEKDYELRALDLKYQYAIEAAKETNRDIFVIDAKFARERTDVMAKYDAILLKRKQSDINAQLDLVRKGTDEELALRLEQNRIAERLTLTANTLKPAAEREDEELIKKRFEKQRQLIKGEVAQTNFQSQQALEKAVFDSTEHSSRLIERFTTKQERDRWMNLIELAEQGSLNWSDIQIETAKKTVERLNRILNPNYKLGDITPEQGEGTIGFGGFYGVMGSISKHGITGPLLEKLGFNDEAMAAFGTVVDKTLDYLQEIIDKEVELAEAAVSAAEARVDAAQSAYDAEVEARNNGYANNVATAKKELELEKQNQREKQRLLEEAKEKQEAINTAMQITSLITATANLWSSLSSVPIIGSALALAAIASMWGSFAAAKIKAREVSTASYGEGGLEFLEGGSHASGHDIDLHTANSRGQNMRAEGGEAMAIINKRQTKKYKKILPDIINSLNKGVFEDKFANAFKEADSLSVLINSSGAKPIDISGIEKDVERIRKRNEVSYCTLPNGDMIVITGNITRIIKK